MKNIELLKDNRIVKIFNNFGSGIDYRYADGVIDSSIAKLCLNFDYKSGVLKKCSGFSSNILDEFIPGDNTILAQSLEGLGEILSCYLFNKSDENGDVQTLLLFLSSEYKIYYINFSSEVKEIKELSMLFTSIPKAISYNLNGEDVIIFCSPTDTMKVWDGIGLPYEVADAPKFVDICIHEERLFALTGDTKTLWFSDDLDPTNWDITLEDAGFIQMIDKRGALRKVVSWNGYIYIFRDYGISRLTASGSQETFSLTHLFTSSNRINCDSVCECGDRIMFLADDGLYTFDGASTTQILTKVSPLISNSSFSKACYFSGLYILSCRIEESKCDTCGLLNNSSNVTNSVMVIDVTNQNIQIIYGIEIKNFCVVNLNNKSKLLAIGKPINQKLNCRVYVLSDNGKIDQENQKRIWVSSYDDFSRPGKQKVLKTVIINATCDFKLHIISNQDKIVINVKGGNIPYIYNTRLRGVKFKVMIECDAYSDFEIGEIQFIYNIVSYVGGR